MKSRLKGKWLAVGAIWSVILAVTGWNIHLVNRVQLRRQDLAVRQMDLRFLQANQAGIQEVRRHQSRLTHPVKSFGLGFLVVENDLKRLSWDFDLGQLRVEAENPSQDTPSVPISIVASGQVPALVGWLAAVEKAYPYLVIDHMDLSCDDRDRAGQLQAVFNYHYTLAEPDRTG